jgi:hypothetical protein
VLLVGAPKEIVNSFKENFTRKVYILELVKSAQMSMIYAIKAVKLSVNAAIRFATLAE